MNDKRKAHGGTGTSNMGRRENFLITLQSRRTDSRLTYVYAGFCSCVKFVNEKISYSCQHKEKARSVSLVGAGRAFLYVNSFTVMEKL